MRRPLYDWKIEAAANLMQCLDLVILGHTEEEDSLVWCRDKPCLVILGHMEEVVASLMQRLRMSR